MLRCLAVIGIHKHLSTPNTTNDSLGRRTIRLMLAVGSQIEHCESNTRGVECLRRRDSPQLQEWNTLLCRINDHSGEGIVDGISSPDCVIGFESVAWMAGSASDTNNTKVLSVQHQPSRIIDSDERTHIVRMGRVKEGLVEETDISTHSTWPS
ncbi:hypothetical protein BLNAU_22953 [Blattamonas nauphoetae]|uniref:Uncharacterized protein n=1 Tax=Blattamonas nauphoetae TaxID=2049346 RepID=A0ABQ9WVS3_9EUKA|nr:hypothetical protein BLNAU_22953 [Blattamonas nauphoetae]